MTAQSNQDRPLGEQDISSSVAVEINNVISEAKSAGLDEDETVSALDKPVKQARQRQSSSRDPLQELVKTLDAAQQAAMNYGNERIIYLVGLARDEAKARQRDGDP